MMRRRGLRNPLVGCTRRTAILIEGTPEREQVPEPDPALEANSEGENEGKYLEGFIEKDDKSSYCEQSSAAQSESSGIDQSSHETGDKKVDESPPITRRLRKRSRVAPNYAPFVPPAWNHPARFESEDESLTYRNKSTADSKKLKPITSGREYRVTGDAPDTVAGESNGASLTAETGDNDESNINSNSDFRIPPTPSQTRTPKISSSTNLKRERTPTASSKNLDPTPTSLDSPQSERARSAILRLKLRQARRSSPPNDNAGTQKLVQELANEKAARMRLQEECNGLKWEIAEKDRAYDRLMRKCARLVEDNEGLKKFVD